MFTFSSPQPFEVDLSHVYLAYTEESLRQSLMKLERPRTSKGRSRPKTGRRLEPLWNTVLCPASNLKVEIFKAVCKQEEPPSPNWYIKNSTYVPDTYMGMVLFCVHSRANWTLYNNFESHFSLMEYFALTLIYTAISTEETEHCFTIKPITLCTSQQ